MKKTLLTFLLLTSLAYAQSIPNDTNKRIAQTKAQIAELQANLVKLESSLLVQMQKEKELAIAKKIEANKLKMHTEFGFIGTKGNTETLTYNLDTKIQKAFNKHEWTFLGDGEYASDSGTKTKNKYFLEIDYAYKLDEKLYFEYVSAYKHDEFSGFDYQAYTGPGFKYKALRSETQVLDLSSTLLLSKDKKETDANAYNYTSFRAKIDYSWQMLENLKVEETLSYRTDVTMVDDYFIYSKTALVSKISDIFSVGLNYKVDYINLTEIGKKKADRALSANLIADF